MAVIMRYADPLDLRRTPKNYNDEPHSREIKAPEIRNFGQNPKFWLMLIILKLIT